MGVRAPQGTQVQATGTNEKRYDAGRVKFYSNRICSQLVKPTAQAALSYFFALPGGFFQGQCDPQG